MQKKTQEKDYLKILNGKIAEAKKRYDESGGNYWNGKKVAFEEISSLFEELVKKEKPPKKNWLMFWLGIPAGQALLVLFLKILNLL